MTLLAPDARKQAQAIAELFHHNPFRDARGTLEARALGEAYIAHDHAWSHDREDERNQRALERLTASLVDTMRTSLRDGARLDREDRTLYTEVGLVALYDAFAERLDSLVEGAPESVAFYDAFCAEYDALFFDERVRPNESVAHTFALFFQLRRAFFYIFRFLLGQSAPAARLRAEIWDSIFTHDVARYRRALYAKLGEVSTLITGPSGTGKELVARAIGLSRYVPFSTRTRSFRWDPARAFLPLNLSALTPTLVESELFGHKKGAFTGATSDRDGWLAACPAFGAVFLDEIGEIEPALQVKLLRVLESRAFSPMGSTDVIPFTGKIIAATNREFGPMLDAGSFREDLYFRLCSNRIEAPSLHARAVDDPREIERLVTFFAAQSAGDVEGPALGAEVMAALKNLPPDYRWPGNIRELSQAVRQVLVTGHYRPPDARTTTRPAWLDAAAQGTISLEALQDAYVQHVYAQVGSYEGTARRLEVDRRTVKARTQTDSVR